MRAQANLPVHTTPEFSEGVKVDVCFGDEELDFIGWPREGWDRINTRTTQYFSSGHSWVASLFTNAEKVQVQCYVHRNHNDY